MRREWIGRIDFDPGTAWKIRIKHGLSEDEIREAIMFDHDDTAIFGMTPYGERLLAVGTTAAGVRLKAFLRPVDRTDGHWECMTAVRVD